MKTLNPNERIDELARMLGGIDITDQAREHAREMLLRVATGVAGAGAATATANEPAAARGAPSRSAKAKRAKSAPH